MDAYSGYILKLANDHASDLRRETRDYALSRAARRRRGSLWARITGRVSAPRAAPVVPLPVEAAETTELRRSA